MQNVLKFVFLSNGIINVAVGAGLVLFPAAIASLLGYQELSDSAVFTVGGWGIAAITLGMGRIYVRMHKQKYLLWCFLGLLEGIMLSCFCLYHYWQGTITFIQGSVPLIIAAGFGICYAVCYPQLSRAKD